MVPFDSRGPRPDAHRVMPCEEPYPREVMEAGWVPDAADLGRLKDARRLPEHSRRRETPPGAGPARFI